MSALHKSTCVCYPSSYKKFSFSLLFLILRSLFVSSESKIQLGSLSHAEYKHRPIYVICLFLLYSLFIYLFISRFPLLLPLFSFEFVNFKSLSIRFSLQNNKDQVTCMICCSAAINSTKSSRATSHVRCLYETDVSRAISFIITSSSSSSSSSWIWYQTSDAANSPRRFNRIMIHHTVKQEFYHLLVWLWNVFSFL